MDGLRCLGGWGEEKCRKVSVEYVVIRLPCFGGEIGRGCRRTDLLRPHRQLFGFR